MAALRCHLLIGPPASGKTTIAAQLAPLLEAELFSTDRIREELYGDPMIQGNWREVEERLHQGIQAAVAAGRPVLIDATHAHRPWRLALTQRLQLDRPVEWIGWWLRTPLEVCLAWNRQRERQVPELVIHQFAAALDNAVFAPERAEGFAALVDFDPSLSTDLQELLQYELGRVDDRIDKARKKDNAKELHGYSRLLDLERLLYLLQLLSTYPGLNASDGSTRAELEAICNPLPEGSMVQRAAAFLARRRGESYADVEALEGDLAWLEDQGFFSATPVRQPIAPPPAPANLQERNLGGWPPMADRPVFVRVFSLLRHLLQSPFDHQRGVPLTEQLIASLGGVYLPGESGSLRKDVQHVLTPYGFRTRHDNARHGYGLGAAVLPAARLREVHQVVRQAASRLGDPTAQDLLAEFEERLRWGGLLRDDDLPVRTFANRSIVHPDLVRRDSLAVPQQAERLDAAIAGGQRLLLERFSDAARFEDSEAEPMRVWPLQLLFHNIGWYLAYEDDAVGRDRGLIRTERLDRLALRRVDSGFTRPLEARTAALARLARLMELSGGIFSAMTARPRSSSPMPQLNSCLGCSPRCDSAVHRGCTAFCGRACSAIPSARCAFPGPCPPMSGGSRPRPRCCSNPWPMPAIPTRWRSICRPGPSPATWIPAAGCSATGRRC
jgi:predicted kinase